MSDVVSSGGRSSRPPKSVSNSSGNIISSSPLTQTSDVDLTQPLSKTQSDSANGNGDTAAIQSSITASPSSYRERNPEFGVYKLPIEEQFDWIEDEFIAIERSTMNPRMYNFKTSSANPAKNRYMDVLANEDTIFPSPSSTVAGPNTKAPRLSTSGFLSSTASACSSSVGFHSSAAKKTSSVAGQGILGTLRGSLLRGGFEGNKRLPTNWSVTKQPQCYINANRVDMGVQPLFVASQAPVPECINDFLSAIYHCGATLVLMLTKVEEAGIVKADRYWPHDDALVNDIESFGSICVYKDEQDPYSLDDANEIIRRPFYIRPSSSPKAHAHKVVMYQYVGWPDRGVPDSTKSFEELLDIIQRYVQNPPVAGDLMRTSGSVADFPNTPKRASVTASGTGGQNALPPVFVHCSAGIGRTGTLIGAYTALKMTEGGGLTDRGIRRIVMSMRKARFGMVQRFEQYMFLYMIVLRYMGIDTSAFTARMQPRADMYNARLMEARNKALLSASAAKR